MSVGQQVDVCGGVDTHRDVHMAAVVDSTGRVLGTAPFRADAAGYQQLGDWLGSHGRVVRVGIEGAGSYGAGLARYLTEAGVEVTEVNRPNRQLHRRLGKTDATDAQGAARAVLNGQATAAPKSGNGRVEAIRMLSVARRSATKAGLSNRLCEGVGSWVFSGLGLVGWGSGFRVGLGLFSSRGRRRRGFLLVCWLCFLAASRSSLRADWSVGKCPLVLVTFRS